MGGFLESIQKINSKVDKVLGYGGTPEPPDVRPLNSGNLFNYRDNFLHLLNQWEFSIPNSNLWIVYITPYPAGLNARDFILREGTDGSKKPNNIDTDIKKLTSEQYQRTDAGCVFAQGVNIPPEQMSIQHTTMSQNHNRNFLPGVVGGPRSTFQPLIIQFRETNTSFTHSVVRPWIILASHHGMVARPAGSMKNMKTTVQLIQFGKTAAQSPLINRKIYKFHDCVPMSYDAANLNYISTEPMTFSTQWAFSRYTVETLPETDVNLLINDVEKTPFLNFLDKITKGKASKVAGKAEKIGNAVKDAGKTIGRGKRFLETFGL